MVCSGSSVMWLRLKPIRRMARSYSWILLNYYRNLNQKLVKNVLGVIGIKIRNIVHL